MPFRQRQKLVFGSFCKTTLPSTSVDDVGNVIDILEDVHKTLPSPDNFRLGVLLKAGVNLEEVNTTLFPAKSVDSSIFKQPDVKQPNVKQPDVKQPDVKQPDVKQPDFKPATIVEKRAFAAGGANATSSECSL